MNEETIQADNNAATLQIKRYEQQVLSNSRVVQKGILQEQKRADAVKVVEHTATIKHYRAKNKKRQSTSTTKKACALLEKSVTAADDAMAVYKKKEKVVESEEETETEPQEPWKVMNHIIEKGTAYLQVDTFTVDNGDRVCWTKPGNLIKDGKKEIVKAYIEEYCNFGPWLDIIKQMEGTYKPRKQLKKAPKALAEEKT